MALARHTGDAVAREVDHRPDLRFGVPFAVLAIGGPVGAALWTWSMRDRLPEQIAHHWSAGGQATSTAELRTILVFLLLLPVISSVPLALGAIFGRPPLPLRRSLAATGSFLVVFITALLVDSVRLQLDLVDGMDAPGPDVGLGAALLLGGLAAAGAAWLVRDDERSHAAKLATDPPPRTALRREDVASTDALSWQGPPIGVDIAALVTLLVGAGMVVVGAALTSWWLAALALPMVGLSGVFARFVVQVDTDGLQVRTMGRRVLTVPLEQVAHADVLEVDPFWEFGGWGLRVDVAGRVGLVTRKGPAVRVHRGDGSQVLITVEDAQTAAATLNSLADRRVEA